MRPYTNTEPDENTLVDGEPLGERVRRLRLELWSKHLDDLKAGKHVKVRCYDPHVTVRMPGRQYRSDDHGNA